MMCSYFCRGTVKSEVQTLAHCRPWGRYLIGELTEPVEGWPFGLKYSLAFRHI